MNISNPIIHTIKKYLVEELNPEFIYLFGSSVDGDFTEDSNIDIAICMENDVRSYELFIKKEELASMLNRDVDLVDIKKCTSIMKAQIINKGESIHIRDDKMLEEFKDITLKEYAVLNVIYNKSKIIDVCVKRINEEYEQNKDNIYNSTKQDSILLNIQRTSEACLDLALFIVSTFKMGTPKTPRDVISLLQENNIIDERLCKKIKALIGFRSFAVHNYDDTNMDIIECIINNHLDDIMDFKNTVMYRYC